MIPTGSLERNNPAWVVPLNDSAKFNLILTFGTKHDKISHLFCPNLGLLMAFNSQLR